MLAEPRDDIALEPFRYFTLHLSQREMNDVVMVQLLVAKLLAQLQPDFVQQVNLLGREARRVRT